MKKCHACGEEFEGKFSFCPIDGNLLAEFKPNNVYQYHLTLITEKSLARRLASESRFHN